MIAYIRVENFDHDRVSAIVRSKIEHPSVTYTICDWINWADKFRPTKRGVKLSFISGGRSKKYFFKKPLTPQRVAEKIVRFLSAP